MATIQPTTAPVQQIPAPTAKSALGADFNMFLKLLTTQMQNQDPLSPMDSTQYTQQLVQYSQVEQSIQQSGTLKEILARLSTQDMLQAAGFIGKDAVFNSPVSGLGERPASWSFTADRTIATGTATVRNEKGTTVFTGPLEVSGSTGKFSWDGTLADGTKAPHGAYTLAIQAVDAAGSTVTPVISSSGTVGEVTSKNGVVSLGVNGVPMPIDTLVRLAAGL